MTVNINGIDTNYISEGSGNVPVLILPGWSATSAVYSLMVKTLSETRAVCVLDLPGFGITPEPEEPWSVDDYADFVTSFIGELGLSRVVLAGHSFGARIIIKLAARENPFEIESILLVDGAGIKNPPSKKQQKRQARFKKLKKFYSSRLVSRLFPGALAKLQKKFGSADYAAASPVMRATLVKAINEDLSPLLCKIKQKTLLIWGENDDATPISDAYKMKAEIPDATLETIAGAGHFPFIDSPFEFKRILCKYFR